MGGNIAGRTMNWFTINENLSRAVTAGELIDTSEISAVCFDEDVNLTCGNLSFTFPLTAGTPMGIDYTVDTISIDVAANMFAMGR